MPSYPVGAIEAAYYKVPTQNAAPWAITIDTLGNVWFTEENSVSNKIGVFFPENGSIKEFQIPTPQAEARSITAASDGTIWFVEHGGNKVASLSPVDGKITEWPIFTAPPAGRPEGGVALDSKGYVWFLEPAFGTNGTGTVDRLNPHTGEVVKYASPTCNRVTAVNETVAASQLTALIVDLRDNVWVTDMLCNWVGLLTPNATSMSLYSLPYTPKLYTPAPGLGYSGGLVIDHGGRLWFTESYDNKIGTLEPATGISSEWPVPIVKDELWDPGPWSLAVDSRGHVWFTQPCTNSCYVGEFDPSVGAFVVYSLGAEAAEPRGIAVDKSDNVWFTAMESNKIVRLSSLTDNQVLITGSTTSALSSAGSATQTTVIPAVTTVPELSHLATVVIEAIVLTMMILKIKRKRPRKADSFS